MKANSQPSFQRKQKLIKPRLQLKYSMIFLITGFSGVLIQAAIIFFLLSSLANDVPNDGIFILDAIPRLVLLSLAVASTTLVPITLCVGILTTFRFVGPLYRMEQHLAQIIRGERPEDCHLRKRDELHDFCALLNQATAPVRKADLDPVLVNFDAAPTAVTVEP